MTRKSEDIFAILARENELALVAFVRACVHDDSSSDDIVQETLLTAWRTLDRFDRERPFIAWLRGIAKNKILEHYRACATTRQYAASFTPEMIGRIAQEHDRLTSGPGDTFADRLASLRQCIDSLDPNDRYIVEYHYRDRQSCRTIAAHIGFNFETIKKRLQRARAELRDCILGKLEVGANHA